MQEHVVQTTHTSPQNVCDIGFILYIETSTNICHRQVCHLSHLSTCAGWFYLCSPITSLSFFFGVPAKGSSSSLAVARYLRKNITVLQWAAS